MPLTFLVHPMLCTHNHTFCFRVMTTRAAEAARMLAEYAPRATTFTGFYSYINTLVRGARLHLCSFYHFAKTRPLAKPDHFHPA
jgi:hypothetical protein